MAEYAKRPEVTVSTMGKVHNPTGEGVRAISTQVQAKSQKHKAAVAAPPTKEQHETVVKEGTSKRNITRKKTDGRDTGNFDSRNKKQGGHGKGKWKDDELAYYEAPIELDKNDPLYDEQHTPGYILSSHEDPKTKHFDESANKPVYGPMLTLPEFKLQVQDIVLEYFDSCDAEEVIRSIEELKCKEYHAEIVKKAVSVSLDKNSRERELVSRLLTCLHPNPLPDDEMAKGFDILLDALDEMIIDVPDSHTLVANFLARAVVDEVLPPAYLSHQNNARPGDPVIEKAVSLLSREHCTARLERVWGPGDGRPVEDLKIEMDHLLQEYLMSRELDEAARCVKDLGAPHYIHELVKRGGKIAMEYDGKDASTQHEKHAIDAMAALFIFLVKNAIISETQVFKGVSRLHKILDDIKLDVPAAATLLDDFENMLREEMQPEEEKKQ